MADKSVGNGRMLRFRAMAIELEQVFDGTSRRWRQPRPLRGF